MVWATELGADKDEVLYEITDSTYFASDIAYHRNSLLNGDSTG